jgi:hypothetical protein
MDGNRPFSVDFPLAHSGVVDLVFNGAFVTKAIMF